MEFAAKIKTLEELAALITTQREAGKRIVHCHGVFDLIHLGHVRYLTSARGYGDLLIVTLTADTHVKRGPGRPVFNQTQRAEMLANLALVDYVTIAQFPTALECIEAIKPHFYVKGPDYKNKDDDVTEKIYDEEAAVKKYGGQLVFTEDISFSSSKLLNTYLDSYPEATNLYLKGLSKNYSIDTLREYFEKVRSLRIGVIGDAIIDQYHYCSPLGKSAKENIVANKYISDEDFAGGVLATANHAAQICDSISLITALGADNSFEEFIASKLDPRVKMRHTLREGSVTTVKRRYVNSIDQKKLFEICYLDDTPLGTDEERAVLDLLADELHAYDLIIINDFGHGLLTKRLRNLLASQGKKVALNVQTNSANIGFNLVTNYPQADFVCIDEHELRLATRDKFSDFPALLKRLYQTLGSELVISTRGPQGSLALSAGKDFYETPAFAKYGVDKVGAGDAFFAYAAPCFAAGMPPDLIGFVGNVVGALKLQIVGNKEPVRKTDTLKFMERLLKV